MGQSLDPFRDWVPRDAKQICDPGHTCQVIVIVVLVHKGTGSRRRPENQKVINPLKDWGNLFAWRILTQVSVGVPWIPPMEERPSKKKALCCI